MIGLVLCADDHSAALRSLLPHLVPREAYRLSVVYHRVVGFGGDASPSSWPDYLTICPEGTPDDLMVEMACVPLRSSDTWYGTDHSHLPADMSRVTTARYRLPSDREYGRDWQRYLTRENRLP